ncbi:oxidoreductase [Phytoactinopolyspora halotolerans]|uniref:Oxidoreductase n=1 Tax=Phytoactinopolyspora halotolerans TaxID=1981512 RepID=A0A6L9S2U6_9ACTN|nr:oxidoreductase [Phytoactinopolyspora halotolerans]NED99140.1 oxidoreductase [Phytoactinopolyspora halotolerans]
MDDPLADVAALNGVGAAAAYARDSIDALLRQPAMRTAAASIAAESAVRGARASATMAGGDADDVNDPSVQGALRAVAEVPELARLWERSPRQVLARLHVLAARDLVDDAEALGRPRAGADSSRLDQILRVATAPTGAPGVVVAAVVHAELLSIRPFGTGDGLVARAAERIVLVARGVDTKAVSIPEAGHLALVRAYEPLLNAYADGGPEGVGAWVRHCAEAYAHGAAEAMSERSGLVRDERGPRSE